MVTETVAELRILIEQLKDLCGFMEREGERAEAEALSVRIATLSNKRLRLGDVDPTS